ncbi:MAG TPA: hypothetical protein VHD38_00190 [Candidatus Paceibacterota bacterium]|nr:hypothetical protein [Candidatus Paceibacterota bacterium]
MIKGVQRKVAYVLLAVLAFAAFVLQYAYAYFSGVEHGSRMALENGACVDTDANDQVLFVNCSGFF